jgi:DNA-binding CsgD family transcriptional regulator
LAELKSVADLRRRVSDLIAEGGGPWSSGVADEIDDVEHALAAALAARLAQLTKPGRSAVRLAREANELNELACELASVVVGARLRAVERVQAASGRLAERGPVSEIVDRAASEACTAADLDRVIISRVDDGWLRAEAAHVRGDPIGTLETLRRAQATPVCLAYPLVEAEVLRRRRPHLVTEVHVDDIPRHAYAATMGWTTYVATPIVLEARVIGFFHGDRVSSGRPLQALDRDALWQFAGAFADIFERAVLHWRLRIQRQEVRQVASWAEARTGELSDGAIDLALDRPASQDERIMPSQASAGVLGDVLTRRELDVLEHMARGGTNADIARALVVAEGTVKFHVKNILRKLRVANRAAAISQYMRTSLQRENATDDASAAGR